jgi:hypothetical protein
MDRQGSETILMIDGFLTDGYSTLKPIITRRTYM